MVIDNLKLRLDSVEEALNALISCYPDDQKIPRHWFEFISFSNAFFNQVASVSKKSQENRVRYLAIASDRKKDELMSYIHHARNMEEHNVLASTEEIKGQITFNLFVGKEGEAIREKKKQEIIFLGRRIQDYTKLFKDYPQTIPPRIGSPVYKPVTVIDRGISFSPPQKHLGMTMGSEYPRYIAALAFEYKKKLLNDLRMSS